jgi:GH15 family glucan-1,4-alpha-glucosidase
MNRLEQNHGILDSLRLPNGLYKASHSHVYSYVWLRDSFYEVLPYLHSNCNRYEQTYHRILDIFRDYEWKIDYHTQHKPHAMYEYIHARFDIENGKEINQEWGNCQHDAVGAILFGIGEGLRAGKKIFRDQKDHDIVQKLVYYLYCCQYWMDADNGMWEEWREVHSSSVGACIAGLQSVREFVFVPRELITKGYVALANMFPYESADRPVDLSQLSLIYPYKVFIADDAKMIIDRVEGTLLKTRGVIRYKGDSYFSTIENEGRHYPLTHYYNTEAEWTFGLPWLALAHMELGNIERAKMYISWTEAVMLEDGRLPELYFAGSDKYNENTPLGWSQAMYIIAKERYLKEFSE